MVNGYVLKRVRVMKCLGVLIDEELHWTQQVGKVARTVQSKLGILRRVKSYIPKECLNLLYKSLVQPHLDYCSQIWSDRFQMHIAKLEKLQKPPSRIILNKDYHTPSTELFQDASEQTIYL